MNIRFDQQSQPVSFTNGNPTEKWHRWRDIVGVTIIRHRVQCPIVWRGEGWISMEISWDFTDFTSNFFRNLTEMGPYFLVSWRGWSLVNTKSFHRVKRSEPNREPVSFISWRCLKPFQAQILGFIGLSCHIMSLMLRIGGPSRTFNGNFRIRLIGGTYHIWGLFFRPM
jgi:hypothetical protein